MKLEDIAKLALILPASSFGWFYLSTKIIEKIKRKNTLENKIKNMKISKIPEQELESFHRLHYTPEEIRKVEEIFYEGSYEEAIKSLNTLTEAAIYCSLLRDNTEKFLDSERMHPGALEIILCTVPHKFEVIHTVKIGKCSHAVVAAAALLNDQENLYPYVVRLEEKRSFFKRLLNPGEESRRHVILVFKTLYNGKELYGSIGLNKSDIQPFIHKNLSELIKAISSQSKTKYGLLDIVPIGEYAPRYMDRMNPQEKIELKDFKNPSH